MFEFYYQHEKQRRKLFQVHGSFCTVGSSRNNDLTVSTPKIGKRHAEFKQEADGIYLRDLGSLGGCWVNRERIECSGPLSELDEVILGDVHITLRDSRKGHTAAVITATQALSNKSGVTETVARLESEFTREPEPALTGQDKNLVYWGRIVHEQLLVQMDLQRRDVNRMSDTQLREETSILINEIVRSLEDQLPQEIDRAAIQRHVLNESVGLGPLELLLSDESVTEIMVNNHREIFIERNGVLEKSSMQFSSDKSVSAVIDRIITPLGRRIDESSPIVDARLKDGSRVNAVIPPLALKGPTVTIRKFPKHMIEFNDLLDSQVLNQSMLDFLQTCVESRKNIVVSGGTGSGKTTLLNVLSRFIPETDRIVTIEDAAELKLVQPNLVALESRPPNLDGKGEIPIRDLVRNALRMRPDRIVVGECRGGEALDMLQAMNTGHDGSLTTLHANSPRDALSRLEVLVLMAGMDLPITAIREQVSSAVDIILQQQRFACGSRKITRITEVVGMESGIVQLQDIFRFDQQSAGDRQVSGRFVATGAVPTFYESLRDAGIQVNLSGFQAGNLGMGL